jgi:ABC-type phosphate/phosphonate transport system permease subunit
MQQVAVVVLALLLLVLAVDALSYRARQRMNG